MDRVDTKYKVSETVGEISETKYIHQNQHLSANQEPNPELMQFWSYNMLKVVSNSVTAQHCALAPPSGAAGASQPCSRTTVVKQTPAMTDKPRMPTTRHEAHPEASLVVAGMRGLNPGSPETRVDKNTQKHQSDCCIPSPIEAGKSYCKPDQ